MPRHANVNSAALLRSLRSRPRAKSFLRPRELCSFSSSSSRRAAERRRRGGADHPELLLARPRAAIGRHALCGHRTRAWDHHSRRHQGLELVPHCQLTMRTSMSAKMATCSGCSSHSARYGCWQWLCASSMGWARCASAHSLSVVLSLKRESHRWHHRVCHACHRIELCRCLLRWSIDKEALPATKHAFLVLGAGSGATETA